jgi:hypothetical protein
MEKRRGKEKMQREFIEVLFFFVWQKRFGRFERTTIKTTCP